MQRQGFWIASLAFSVVLGCSGSGGMATAAAQGLMGEMGGMGSMSKLAGSFLQTSAADSRLSGLMNADDADAMQPKLSNQFCSMLGGGCAAPLSEDQIAKGAEKARAVAAETLAQAYTRVGFLPAKH